MILLYSSTLPGEVFYAVYQYAWDRGFEHTTNIPLTEFYIPDELASQALCRDLSRTQGRRDATGQRKYYVDDVGSGFELFERDGWEEYIEPPE